MRKLFGGLAFVCVLATAWLLALHAQEAELGKAAPDFSLEDMDGKPRSLSEFNDKFVVLEWVNHGCPFVKKHYDSGNMQALQKDMKDKGAVWLSICSSAEGKQGHFSGEEWEKLNQEKGTNADAVLLDPDGAVGKSYGAKTTPHMFVIHPNGTLIYKGAMDDKPSTDRADIKSAQNFVRLAMDQSLAGRNVRYPLTRPYGCSVKYK